MTFACEPSKFLPLVEQNFLKNGGTVVRRKINDFKELANDFDIIVNCTGLQAKELTGDDSVKPIRGQIARVRYNIQILLLSCSKANVNCRL